MGGCRSKDNGELWQPDCECPRKALSDPSNLSCEEGSALVPKEAHFVCPNGLKTTCSGPEWECKLADGTRYSPTITAEEGEAGFFEGLDKVHVIWISLGCFATCFACVLLFVVWRFCEWKKPYEHPPNPHIELRDLSGWCDLLEHQRVPINDTG